MGTGGRSAENRLSSSPGPGAPEGWQGQGRRIAFAILAIGLATALIYAQTLEHEFVDWDDYGYFVESSALDGQLDAADLVSAFTETHMANWSPLTSITILVGDAIHGPDPRFYLLGNAALHFAASVLLFLWLFRMTGAYLASAWVGLIFAVHPLHVESVAWASERKDVLAGALWMACLLAYAFHRERPSTRRYAGVVLLGALAGLSKPTVVALPVTLLLLDYWPLGRLTSWGDFWLRLREKWPFFGLALIVAGLTILAQGTVGASPAELLPWNFRVLNAGLSYWTYLVQVFWPQDMAVFYPYPGRAVLTGWAPLAAWAAGLGLTALAVWASARRPYVLMGWLWFVLTLVPMMGFVQVGGQAHADRYMYVPMVGLLVPLAWALVEAAPRVALRRLGWAAAISASLVGLGVAWQQAGYWRSTTTLFEHALEVTEANSIAHRHLGVAYWSAGDWRTGEEHLRAAVAISPNWGDSRVALADALNQSGRHAEAREQLLRAASLGAESPALHAGLGLAAQGQGKDSLAALEYRRALDGGLDDWEILNNLAWLLATTQEKTLRDPDEAIRLALRALQQVPAQPDVEETLATAYAAAGRSRTGEGLDREDPIPLTPPRRRPAGE